MGIIIEFNPDLNLRSFDEFRKGNRLKEECLPETLVAGSVHDFFKNDQRMYWLEGEVPLRETVGGGKLSRALGSCVILEATHFKKDGKTCTKGKYKIIEVFTDDKVHFDGLEKI